jgi:hypothetical protein
MPMNKPLWTLQQNGTSTEYTTFPFAFRAMLNIARKALLDGNTTITKHLFIYGPPYNTYGDRRKYNYTDASSMAETMGILKDGHIEKRNMKFDRFCKR